MSNEETVSGGLSRRAFLSSAGAAGVVSAIEGRIVMAQENGVKTASAVRTPEAGGGAGIVAVTLRVNGKEQKVRIDPRASLLDCLRESVGLTGTKKGCDHGQCGACTVHVNGRRVLSCLSLAMMHEGDEVTTIEGIGQPGNLHAVQAAFVAHDAYQCGYCTSGQIMSGVALLKEPCGPADADVKELMSGNICRCGAYPNIVAAIQQVRKGA
ncbi:MAG: (2Fe-2S)-binding protein [Phycisphaerales bacterium]|nr:(2Fe-2S)-binding protein [Phycisphaerales bacterium]